MPRVRGPAKPVQPIKQVHIKKNDDLLFNLQAFDISIGELVERANDKFPGEKLSDVHIGSHHYNRDFYLFLSRPKTEEEYKREYFEYLEKLEAYDRWVEENTEALQAAAHKRKLAKSKSLKNRRDILLKEILKIDSKLSKEGEE